MLGWALTFLILALVAGYMGFFGLAGLAASIAKLTDRYAKVVARLANAADRANNLTGRPDSPKARGVNSTVSVAEAGGRRAKSFSRIAGRG